MVKLKQRSRRSIPIANVRFLVPSKVSVCDAMGVSFAVELDLRSECMCVCVCVCVCQ